MKNTGNKNSILFEYLQLERKTVFVAIGLVVCVTVVAIVVYSSINGVDTWKQNMQKAGDMMVIQYNTPLGGATITAKTQRPINRNQSRTTTKGLMTCPKCGASVMPNSPTIGGTR